MCPLSGLSSPRQSFKMVLFPEPATPISVLVSPRFNSNDTPSSKGGPSNSMQTLSKMIALWTVSGCGFSMLREGEDIDSPITSRDERNIHRTGNEGRKGKNRERR